MGLAAAPAPGPWSPRRAWVALLWIVAAWVAAAGPALVDHPLDKASKARAWSVARTMAEGGDWVVPTYNGEPRLKKPPLASWAQAAAMKAIGSEALWVAGLVSLLAGTLFAAGPWLLGRALGRETAGFLGSLALCASRAAQTWGASPEHDVAFAGLVALSLAFLARALSAAGRPRDSALAGLATGAALLVKGPFALAFVAGTAVVVTALARRRGSVGGRVRWAPFLGLALLPPLAWLALVLSRLGSVGAVFDEMRRQALGEGGAHVKSGALSLLYYAGTIPKFGLPFVAVGLVAAAALGRSRARDAAAPPPFAGLSFAAIALGVTFLALTATPAKQEHYALSALPPLFLLVGAAFEGALRRWPRLVGPAPAIAAACGLAVLVARAPWLLPVASSLGALTVLVTFGVRGPRRTAYGFLLAAVAVGGAGRIAAIEARASEDLRDDVAQISPATWAQPVVGVAEGAREEFDTVMAHANRPWERERSRDLPLVRRRLEEGGPFLVLVPASERGMLAPVQDRLVLVAHVAPPAPRSDRDRFVLYRARLREK